MVLKKIGFVVGCFGLYHLAKRFVGVRPGMFVAPDNRIYRGMPEGGPVSGVVGFVDGDKALALCLTERSYPWSSSCISVPETRTMTSGLAATRKILETARKLGKKAEAAEWCANYPGIKAAEVFLPSIFELKRLLSCQDIINRSLDMLGGGVHLLDARYPYLSSNEESSYYVWTSLGPQKKNETHLDLPASVWFNIRPVFWVDLKKAEFI